MNKMWAAAAASVVLSASAANAQSVHVTNVAFTPGSVSGTIHAPSGTVTAGIGQFEFRGNYTGSTQTFDLFTYCVDLTHSVSLGTQNYTDYTIAPISQLTTDATKINGLNALLTHTLPALAGLSGQAAVNYSAATQMAVWEIMFETASSWTVSSNALYMSTPSGSTSTNTTNLLAAETLANGFLTSITSHSWMPNNNFQLKLLASPTHQTQVFLAAVPEPTTWAMMIAGFGLVGGAMRSRKRVAAVAA